MVTSGLFSKRRDTSCRFSLLRRRKLLINITSVLLRHAKSDLYKQDNLNIERKMTDTAANFNYFLKQTYLFSLFYQKSNSSNIISTMIAIRLLFIIIAMIKLLLLTLSVEQHLYYKNYLLIKIKISLNNYNHKY